MIDSTDLITGVNYKDFLKLPQLIKEKRDGQETVIKTKGLEIIYKAMKASNKAMKKSGEKEIYSEELIGLLKQVLDVYEELDKIHKTMSIQSDIEKSYAENIDNLLETIINSINELEEVEVS